MNLRATMLKGQNDRPSQTQGACVLVVASIGCSQVWIGLSETQQQHVAMTVIQICQVLAHQRSSPTEPSGGNHE